MNVLDSNESMEELYDKAPCGYFSALPNGIIIKINSTLLEWLGYKRNDVIGKIEWTSLLTMGGKIFHQTHLIPLFHSRDFIEEINFDFTKSDGEKLPVLINVKSIRNDSGELVLLNIVVIQFTQRKSYEKEILIAKKQAEAASMAKSEFLSNMSHEIRTPLNGVIGFTDLLMQTNLDETQKQYMEIVYKSANSLLDLLNDILDFSKIEAGKLELNIEKVDIFELAGQVSDLIKYKALEKDLEILLNISPDTPRFLFTDPIRLRQIMINLIGNAIKFTIKGEIEIKIYKKEKKINREDGVFIFSVRDTGIGISKENQEKIFHAFSQADSSINRNFGGTGLGLTISNKLLELMGSKLELKSEYGKGSEFYFSLTAKSENSELIYEDDLRKIENVLVVDDNTNNLLLIRDMLSKVGIQTDLFESGHDALGKIEKSFDYDLMIIDYHMPGMDGIELIRTIRNRMNLASQRIPAVLLYSSADYKISNTESLELEIQLKINKPIKIDEFYYSLSKIKVNSFAKVSKIDSRKESSSLDRIQEFRKDLFIKVLIVDDDEINMYLARSILDKIIPNCIILEAVNGFEAVEQFKNEKPDIIFMDVQMPEMNGYEATVEIRKLETGKRIPIIAITAGTVKGEIDQCFQVGMDDYASKPVKQDLFTQMLSKWLDINHESLGI